MKSTNTKKKTVAKKAPAKKAAAHKKVSKVKVKKNINILDSAKKCAKKNPAVFFGVIALIIVVIAVICCLVVNKIKEDKYNSLPPRVEYSMTSYYGYIDDIVSELGLDFDLVTAGANCYTGLVKNEYPTEKYGILHTEFRYCKSNKTTVFRVYNIDTDQELRDPKPGELPTFDSEGHKLTNGYAM